MLKQNASIFTLYYQTYLNLSFEFLFYYDFTMKNPLTFFQHPFAVSKNLRYKVSLIIAYFRFQFSFKSQCWQITNRMFLHFHNYLYYGVKFYNNVDISMFEIFVTTL